MGDYKMPKIYGNVIKAVKGEDVPIASAVYDEGVLVDNIASAMFAYVGGAMTAPVEDTATVEGNSVVSYVLTGTDTSALDDGLYSFCFKTTTSDGLTRVTAKGYIVVEEDIFVIPEVPN